MKLTKLLILLPCWVGDDAEATWGAEDRLSQPCRLN